MPRNFMELLQSKWDEGKFACVGLDSDASKLPEKAKLIAGAYAQSYFNAAIVDATKDLVCAYKPNLAFYRGDKGKVRLQETIQDIKKVAPDVPVILDAKYGDIGNTNDGYVDESFSYFGADAVTVHNYLGSEAMKPFLDRADKGVIVLCRTSNKGAGEFQDVVVEVPIDDAEKMGFDPTDFRQDANRIMNYMPLYQYVAGKVSATWNYNGNCAVVVGATYPEELGEVRKIVGSMPILIPGIGEQGGELEKSVRNGANSRGQGMIINSSRRIIFASSGPDFAEAARREAQKLHDAITECMAGRRN